MASEKVDIYMPIYIGDYMADTNELSTEEHGAYLLLLMAAWRRDGRLPSDHERLARLAVVAPARWMRIWGMIGRFFKLDGDAYVQPRLLRELNIALGKKTKASDRARNSAEARWRSRTTTPSSNAASNAPSIPPSSAQSTRQAVPDGMLEECPLPLPSGDLDLSPDLHLSPPGSDSDPAGARSNGRARTITTEVAPPPPPFSIPRRAFPHVGGATPAFLAVFERYPRKDKRMEAAQVFAQLAETWPGGEQALSESILAAFDAGMLKRHPYAGPNATRPCFDRMLAERRWLDPASAPDNEPPPAKHAAAPLPPMQMDTRR